MNKIQGNNNTGNQQAGRDIINNYYNNTGKDMLAELCPLILDEIYKNTDSDDYSLTQPFEEIEKINFINNKITHYKDSLMNFWVENQKIEKLISIKNSSNSSYAGRIYGRFKSLYDDNKYKFEDKENFGDLIIDFLQEKIKEQIKDFHNLSNFPVSDLHEGIRNLTFHAFYKCKILENPNDN